MVPGQYVFLNLDDNEGYRGWIILSYGDKWATLFNPAALETRTVKADELDKMDPAQVGTINPRKLAERIRSKVLEGIHYGIRFSKRNAEKAARMMDALAEEQEATA